MNAFEDDTFREAVENTGRKWSILVAHRTGIERLAHAGAVPTTALAINTELFRKGRRRPPAPPARPSTGTSRKSQSGPTKWA